MFFRATIRRLFPVACATVMLCASAVAHVPRAPVPRAPSVGGATDTRIGFVDFDADGAARLYYYLVDHQQTVLQIVDSTGTVVNTYDYDAYGNVAWDSTNVATNVPNRYLFQGREWDEHAGHYYYRYRTYLPEHGVFTGPDMHLGRGITAYLDSLSSYLALGGNPAMYVDPLGLETRLGGRLMVAMEWNRGHGVRIATANLIGSVEQDIFDSVRLRVDGGLRVYSGGLGASRKPEQYSGLKDGRERDFWLSGSLITGSGSGEGRPAYTGNLYARSAIDDTFSRSITFGSTFNWHSTLGFTRIGHVQVADSDWYLHYNNDVNKFPSFAQFPYLKRDGTDYAWSAGAIFGAKQDNGEWHETGYACFTGKPDYDADRLVHDGKSADGYYDQTDKDFSFNRSEMFLRKLNATGAVMFSFSTPDWLNKQHKVHDGTFPFIWKLGSKTSSRFIHDERRMSGSFEGYQFGEVIWKKGAP